MSALRAGSLNAPAADTVKTSESRLIHPTIGIGQYPPMPAQWLIARRIEPFIEVARNCSTSFPGFLKRSICASTAFVSA
jgi:hypothetical protein